MLSNGLFTQSQGDRLPACVARFRIALLNLSAERCLVMARHPIDWPAATRVRLRYDENCAVATIDWSEEEIAALSFEERLPEQVFNRLARSFIRLDSLALGNAHASKNEIARLVSQEMKERLWCRWSSFEGIYLSSKCEPVVEAI